MKVTVLGRGPASPQPDTPASGLLVQSDLTAILLDCGQGVAGRLVDHIEPARLSAVVIGHMHADHFIDLSALRYRFTWGGRSATRLPVYLPPGGLARFAELAGVVSERSSFFDDAFDMRAYDPARTIRIGALTIGFTPGRHYVPAWGVSITAEDGSRIVYAGDTGPNPDLVRAAAGAELLVLESTLDDAADDDPGDRGHLALDEALDHGRAAEVGRLLITHYPSRRRAAMARAIQSVEDWAILAEPDLVVDVDGAGASTAQSDNRSDRFLSWDGERDVRAAGGPAPRT